MTIKLTQKKDDDSNDGDGNDDGKGDDVHIQSDGHELGGDVTKFLTHQLSEFLITEKVRERCVRLFHLHDSVLVLLTRKTKVDTSNFLF